MPPTGIAASFSLLRRIRIRRSDIELALLVSDVDVQLAQDTHAQGYEAVSSGADRNHIRQQNEPGIGDCHALDRERLELAAIDCERGAAREIADTFRVRRVDVHVEHDLRIGQAEARPFISGVEPRLDWLAVQRYWKPDVRAGVESHGNYGDGGGLPIKPPGPGRGAG